MSENPKHAKPWTDQRANADWLFRHHPVTGRHRKQATK